MAKVYTNTANIGGDYTGTVTVSGPVLLGENITTDGNNIPVVVTGNGTSASSIAPFSFVGGQLARSESSLSFVWNGSDFQDGDPNKPPYSDNNPYLGANLKGTFSINPNGNLDGTFIGSKSLKTHMGELSGFVAQALSSSSFSQDNNIVHKDGTETVTGVKTFTSSIAIGSSNNNKVVIDNSSIHINSNNDGGLLFHFNGNSTPTASLKETESGTLMFGSKLNVSGDSTFESENNKFNGISLSEGKTASFVSGKVYVSTASSNNKSSLAASTEYVDNAIANLQSDAILDLDGTYTGHNKFGGETTFANNISLSSKYNTVDTPVDVNFVNGNLYVADQTGANSSSLAANTKFVKDIAASLSASLRGNKNTIGSGVVPIYLAGTSSLNASLVQSTSNVGNSTVPIYMTGGSLTRMSGTVGDINSPVYLNGGSITQCNTLVNVAATQNVTGEKSFTTPAWFKSAPRVYIDAEKGKANSYNKYCCVDFCLSSLHSTFNEASMRIGFVGSYIDSSGRYTQTNLTAYANKMNDTTTAQIGVRISPDGKEKYVVGVHPTDADGNRLNTTSESNEVIPTIGWTNAYYARKDGATFTGNVTFNTTVSMNSGVELYGSTPYIDFHRNDATDDYTARIIQPSNGRIKITPCASSLANGVQDTAANIFLGSQTIGSGTQPLYLNAGALTASTSNIGDTNKPMYLSKGVMTECSSTVGSTSKPTFMNSGTITALSATKGSTSKPVYLNAGDITELTATVGGTSTPVYLNAGTITKCSSTVGSANQPVYMNGGAMTACNTMVNTSEGQTIGGRKTFSDYAVFAAGASFLGNSSLASTTQLVRTLNSTSWCQGRDAAMIRNGFNSGENQYSPVVSTKAYAGSWEIGAYTPANYLHLTYISDERYNSKVNGVDGQITFETGRYRTVTSMPIGFCSVSGPISGAAGYLVLGNIPCSGGTPTYVKVTVINWGNTAYKASIGGNAPTVGAHSNVTYTYDYASSSSIKVYLQNASLSANFVAY